MHTKIYKLGQRLTPIAAACCLALTSYAAMAEKHKHDDHEMEQHSSHEHGVARLTVATTDDGLEIALESPAANVFGFEHKANSEEERETVHDALEQLNDGATLFAVNAAASCTLEDVNVEAPSAEHHDDDHEQEEKHDEHDKKEKHADHEKAEKHDDHGHEKEEKHDDHDHEKAEKHDDHDTDKKEKHDDHEKEEKHDDHDHEKEEKHDDHDAYADEESSHSDVEAIWAFHCEKPAAIETVNVKLFSAFPGGFEEIAVEWITADNAGKTELKEDGEVSLKP